jgi:DNA-binding response OmpR family regulator
MQREIPVPVPRPRSAAHSHPVASGAAVAARVPRPVALVIDDCRFLAERVARILAARGYDPVVATDGYEALNLIRDHRFDLVVLDVDMPFVSGMTLLRRIRLDAAHADVPVLMLGADPSGEHEIALAQGASGYLAKPLQARSLTAMFDSLLG